MKQMELFQICSKCKKEKGITNFSYRLSGYTTTGRRSVCKQCRATEYQESKNRKKAPSTKIKDLTGQRFGMLVVEQMDGRRLVGGKVTKIFWKCRCDCGNVCVVIGDGLNGGYSKSCGCYRKSFRKLDGDIASFNQLYNTYKRRAKKNNIEFSLTKEEFRNLTGQKCHYCGAEPTERQSGRKAGDPYICNGLDRKDPNKGYVIENVVPCCYVCNIAKHTMLYEEFKDWVRNIYFNFIDPSS